MSFFDKLKQAAIAAGRMSKKTIKATVDAVQEGLDEEEAKEAEETEAEKLRIEAKVLEETDQTANRDNQEDQK